MDKAFFERLTRSVAQMDEAIGGTRQPSRTFEIDAMRIKEIRRAPGLSQSKFTGLISVNVDTSCNWEQGRRSPTRPAKALLRVIANDPQHVLQAFNRQRRGYAIQKMLTFGAPVKMAQWSPAQEFCYDP